MKWMARFVCAAVCAAQLIALCLSSYAANSGSTSLERLGALGILDLNTDGTSSDSLNRYVKRAELFKIVCLIKNGGNKEMPSVYADVAKNSCFSDASELSGDDLPYVGYCVANGLAVADGNGMLRPYEYATYTDCFIVLLRLLGYPVYYILPVNYSSAETWKAGLFDTCRSKGIVSEDAYGADKTVTLGQLSDMICAALDLNTFFYDMLQSSIPKIYITGETLQEKGYGNVETVSAVIVEVQKDGYKLDNGYILKAINPSAALIGYEIKYSTCEKTGFLVTVMLPVYGQMLYEGFAAKYFMIADADDGNVFARLGEEDYTEYMIPTDGSATILCQQYGSNTAEKYTYIDMKKIIRSIWTAHPNAKVRVIVASDGSVKYVKFYD